jgi:putative transposase
MGYGWRLGYVGGMVNYRRNRTQDGTYFFTVTLRNRRSDLLVRRIDALFAAWCRARRRVPHRLVAFVVMPDHLHAVVTMKDGCDDYSRLIQDIKKGFTRRVVCGRTINSPWQSRFWEHTIRDARDLRNHIDYIHCNPVKHGKVARIADWPHSSFHRNVRVGILPVDWTGDQAATNEARE